MQHLFNLSYENLRFPDLIPLAVALEPFVGSSHALDLAKAFRDYGVYGRDKSWEGGKREALWQEMANQFDFPRHLTLNPRFPVELIFFHIAHIPECYRSLIDTVPHTILYRSPSPHYWGNLRSEEGGNPLFANCGRLGKGTFCWIADKERTEWFLDLPKETALQQIQGAISSMEPHSVTPDASLTINAAPSLLREVELVQEKLQTLDPSDVLVMAPDMRVYAPFFNHPVRDYPKTKLFLSLIDSRFEAEKVRTFFPTLPLLDRIIDEMHIEWGFDQEMKRELLGDVPARGSWRFAFHHLLASLPYEGAFSISEFEALGESIATLETFFSMAHPSRKAEYGPSYCGCNTSKPRRKVRVNSFFPI